MTDYPIERIAQDHADDRTTEMETAYKALCDLRAFPGAQAAVLRAVKMRDQQPIRSWVASYFGRLRNSMLEYERAA